MAPYCCIFTKKKKKKKLHGKNESSLKTKKFGQIKKKKIPEFYSIICISTC